MKKRITNYLCTLLIGVGFSYAASGGALTVLTAGATAAGATAAGMASPVAVGLTALWLSGNLPIVGSTCYCPNECIRYGEDNGRLYCNEAARRRCNDNEALSECVHANHEVTDMVNSMGKLADLFLSLASRANPGNFTPSAAGFLRTMLSKAFEVPHQKPVAHCDNGLSTDTTTGPENNNRCFSPELFRQCKRVFDSIDDYTHGLSGNLSEFIVQDPRCSELGLCGEIDGGGNLSGSGTDPEIGVVSQVVRDFIKMIEGRSNLTTANINCASYNATVRDDFNVTTSSAAPAGPVSPLATLGLTGLVTALIAVL